VVVTGKPATNSKRQALALAMCLRIIRFSPYLEYARRPSGAICR
jgi:hypothetical protein